MIYSIHEDNMPKLLSKLQRIENKCKKYGCSFYFKEIGEEFRKIKYDHIKVTARFVNIDVSGLAIINDWKFLATLEHTEHGNVIRSYSEIPIPDKYKTCPPTCEHCHVDRYRKDTYLIQNTKTGEIKQVGKSCLQDYTNGLSAEMVANFASYFDNIYDMSSKSIEGAFKRYINTFDVLLSANDIVSKIGFVSRTRAEEEGIQSTSSKVQDFMNPNKYALQEMEKIGFNPYTKENEQAVHNMLDWIRAQHSDNQYINNLQVVCNNEYNEYRDCGLLASLPSAYFKAMETEKERKAREQAKEEAKSKGALSNFVGSIGDKIDLKDVAINVVTSFDTQYGTMIIYKIVDSENNIYIWKTNKFGIEKAHNLKGTIKNHNEFNGEKQTELTRCKAI